MKKDLFKTRLLSLAVLCGFMLTFVSCKNEDVLQQESAIEKAVKDNNLTAFAVGDETATRTTMDLANGDFYWQWNDYIYVQDDDGVWQKSSNCPEYGTRLAYFKFYMPGKFTAKSSYKVFYPGYNGTNNEGEMLLGQGMESPGLVGKGGDFGTADAIKTINAKGVPEFRFKLNHQASYLVILPYTHNEILKEKCVLQQIFIYSDNDIVGTYTLDPITGEMTGTGGGKELILDCHYSFPLTNTSPSIATNGVLAAIKPGTHTLTMRYWVVEPSRGGGYITKYLDAHTFEKGKYYNITAKLDVKDYSSHHYYMWDATNNYWHQHEWDSADPWQPLLGASANTNYPKPGDPLNRYTPLASAGQQPQTERFKKLPNINELAWYVLKGKPMWDNEAWTTMGHVHGGGMWFLKKANIPGFSTEKDPNNKDLRLSTSYYVVAANYDIKYPKYIPKSELSKYFFLPGLGYYENGSPKIAGYGNYWTSSPRRDGAQAYGLQFSYSQLTTNRYVGEIGCVARPFSDFGDE